METERLYAWGELADYPDKKFQREDFLPTRYIRITKYLYVYDRFPDGELYYTYYAASPSDWKMKWREYHGN